MKMKLYGKIICAFVMIFVLIAAYAHWRQGNSLASNWAVLSVYWMFVAVFLKEYPNAQEP